MLTHALDQDILKRGLFGKFVEFWFISGLQDCKSTFNTKGITKIKARANTVLALLGKAKNKVEDIRTVDRFCFRQYCNAVLLQ